MAVKYFLDNRSGTPGLKFMINGMDNLNNRVNNGFNPAGMKAEFSSLSGVLPVFDRYGSCRTAGHWLYADFAG